MTEPSETLADKIEPLRPFVERTATVGFPSKNLFSSCLKSSLVKAFEFVDLASKQKPDSAFFLVPALRSITEDIIYFRFLRDCPHDSCERAIKNMRILEIYRKLKEQEIFFQTFRPFQRFLAQANAGEENIKEIKKDLLKFWKDNGLELVPKSAIPNIREMAEKSDMGLLKVVYDFIYRLTSGAVHFNPQILLRSVWGDVPSHTFSYKRMGSYYLDLIQIYGVYLLCLHFELFEQALKPGREEKDTVAELRNYILEKPRWPEMVTFEEMWGGFVPPTQAGQTILFHILRFETMKEEGFMANAKRILSRGNGTIRNDSSGSLL